MSNPTIAYPFDPSGTLASNKITAEHSVISPPELSEYYYIIPAAAPFFAEGMTVVHLPSNRTLVEGVDYIPSHYFHDASYATASAIFGSISFYDKTLTGAVRLTYQTLGGDWTLDAAKIVEILSTKLTNPRRLTWEQVADLPYAFPPIDHVWHLDDMVGMSEMVDKLSEIRDALLASGEGGLQAHIADKNNPHGVTKAQVGLELVENYPVASIAEAQAGTAPNRYLTVQRGAQLVQALIGNTMNDHINNSNNPHNTNKSQIGLGDVDNFATATQAEAQAGTAANKFMTVLRTKQLIDVTATAAITAHTSRTDNPHNTNKSHVGLGNVLNYGIATAVDARAGVSNELYMTPAMTREAINSIALQGFSDHVDNVNNPHNVTAEQVGLGLVQNYGFASQAVAEAGTSNAAYMTPLRTVQLIQVAVKTDFTNHINNSNNPHAVTKSQVNLGNVDNFATATTAQAQAGTANNLFLTPAGAAALITAMGGGGGGGGDLAAHVANLNNPHEVTKEQVGLGNVNNYATATQAEAEAGLAADRYMTVLRSKQLIDSAVGNTLSSHINSTANPHNTTAAQVGAYTTAQVDTALSAKLGKTEKAADSDKLDGKTAAEIAANAVSLVIYPATETATENWTLLGQVTLPANQITSPLSDIVAIITGGDSYGAYSPTSTRVVITPRQLNLSTATLETENYEISLNFGYTVSDDSGNSIVRLYARGPGLRRAIQVTPLSQDGRFFVSTSSTLVAEPTGITYLTTRLPPFTRARPSLGDVAFGDLPLTLNSDQTTGSLMEWVSVVDNDDDELTVQTIQNVLREDYHDFIPHSPRLLNYLYGNTDVLDDWGWSTAKDALLLDNTVMTGVNATLTATEYSTNYTLEVELDSDSTKANGLGVLAAVVTQNRRPFALAVIRTPGGAAALDNGTSMRYRLKTIALNPGQIGVSDIASANGTLAWADTGAVDANRVGTDYVEAGHGWDVAGPVRIRVVRAGNYLTIDVTQHGSTSYLAAEQVVIDLEDDTRLAPFVDTPSTWGVISIEQPNATFKVLQRPRMYRDYVRLGVAADNGKQRHYRYNGGAWEMSYLGLNNPLVRPNRLYFSDWNGVMYKSQRNGRLRPVLVEAYSRANPTVLTP
ncbi:hypothetical protein LUCX_308 [Xanthomonas phage vB_XciM_LucasX]|nr:hypothetical protein LUCX_308 [Xanthomonas phage vB_XciM_LucasX]